MGRTICIYHGNCADGFTAAWAVWKALGAQVEFIPGVYGEAPPDVTGADVIMVDFSYKRPVLEAMAAKAHSMLILTTTRQRRLIWAACLRCPTAHRRRRNGAADAAAIHLHRP